MFHLNYSIMKSFIVPVGAISIVGSIVSLVLVLAGGFYPWFLVPVFILHIFSVGTFVVFHEISGWGLIVALSEARDAKRVADYEKRRAKRYTQIITERAFERSVITKEELEKELEKVPY